MEYVHKIDFDKIYNTCYCFLKIYNICYCYIQIHLKNFNLTKKLLDIPILTYGAPQPIDIHLIQLKHTQIPLITNTAKRLPNPITQSIAKKRALLIGMKKIP